MMKKNLAGAILIVVLVVIGFAFNAKGGSDNGAPEMQPQDAKIGKDNSVNVEKEIKELKERIKGREEKPVSEVFKNIKAFDPKMPAGKLPDIMGMWCKALGVNCKTCHMMDQFDSDDQIPKETARGMMQMVTNINTKELKNIKGMDDDSRVGCWTCHHGSKKPESGPPRSKNK
jgi:hypothetical protein